jgi:uncharacterized membrane protein YqjE
MTSEMGTGSGRSPEPPRLLESLRGAADSGVALLSNRLELFGIELAEERVRVLALLAYGAVAFIALGAGIVFLAMFVTVLMWESNRLLALGIFATVFLGGGMVALITALGYASKKSSLFAASLAELRKDRDALKPEQ